MEEHDLSTRRLLRNLCKAIAGEVISDPEHLARLQPRLEDAAYSVLLGLHPEAAPGYVPPGEREQLAAAGLAAAEQQLQLSGYPSLACDLEAATARFKSSCTFHLLGTLTEADNGALTALPLTEHASLLALMLALQGTRPSLRQQRFTFQHPTTTPQAAAAAGGSAAASSFQHRPPGSFLLPAPPARQQAALTSSVFSEAPNPYGLSEGAAAVAVLLPRELGCSTDAFSGREDIQDLGAGLSSRPVWNSTPASALQQQQQRRQLGSSGSGWLPLPAALLELQADGGRRGAASGPLGLPLSLLSMGDEPGTNTLFAAADEGPAAAAAAAEEGPGGAALGGRSSSGSAPGGDAAPGGILRPGHAPDPAAKAAVATVGLEAVRQLGLSCNLWSLREAELAQQALLALQGIRSSLYCLQALLAAPAALPRRSIAGLLRRLVAAGKLRQRLQRFVAAFSSGGGGGTGGSTSGTSGTAASTSGTTSGSDPVQHAFAAAVAQVLQRQAAALQQLEQQQGSSWAETVAVGGTQGRRLHRRGPTLLQVALHTGRLQLQLRSLAGLCWCISESDEEEESCEMEADAAAAAAAAGQRPGSGGSSGSSSMCLWEEESFPASTHLLGYLYRRATEADDVDAPMLRFLFVEAMRPYLRHMHSWAFTTDAVSREFGTAGDKELLTLDFLHPQQRQAGLLVPVDPPAFLQPVHAAFMRAGSQLRLLHSLEGQGRQLVQQLGVVAELELSQRQRGTAAAAAAGQQQEWQQQQMEAAHSVTSFSGLLLPAAAAAAGGGGSGDAAGVLPEQREPWLALAGCLSLQGGSGGSSSGGAASGCQDLQLSSSRLQEAVQISQERDAARTAAVDGWLAQMALGRRLAEHAEAAEQLGRAAAQRAQQADKAARQAAALSQQQSSKAALLQEQQAAVAERCARLAAQQAQQDSEDRQMQMQAARQQHSAAVGELEVALGQAALSSSRPLPPAAAVAAAAAAAVVPLAAAASPAEAEEAAPQEAPQAAGAAAVGQSKQEPGAAAADAVAAGSGQGQQQRQQRQQQQQKPPAQTVLAAQQQQRQERQEQQRQQQLEQQRQQLPAGLAPLRTRAKKAQFQDEQQQLQQQQANAAPPASARQAAAAAAGGPPAAGRQPLLPGLAGLPPAYLATSSWEQQLAAAAAAAVPAAGCRDGGSTDGYQDVLAPLSAVLETSVTQSVLSQYRAASKACVRLFLDELKVLEHLEALRRFFFMGAGDWADALVQRLGAHADSLRPLTGHQAEALLAEAGRGTSIDSDPYAAHLRIRLTGTNSSLETQVGDMSCPTPQRRAKSVWSNSDTVSLVPAQLDVFDCITLDYQVGWPLSAVITQDSLQGYSAVFSMMARVRRCEQLLRGLHSPLASQAKSTADLLLSEDDADRAHRRIQRLRAFHFGATHFVGALQAFLQSRTAGDAWVHLLAKLMVSSEEVAATVISRQPSAPMTGLLSRMISLGPAGKAAHKLAQQLTRALSRASSLPGTPSAAAAAAARGGGGGGGGAVGSQLARFNSLLSAASAASSAANSAATSPRGGAPEGSKQMSRFASSKMPAGAAAAGAAGARGGVPAGGGGGGSAHGAAADQATSQQQRQQQPRPATASAATSPTAAAAAAGGRHGGGRGGLLSKQVSFTSALLAQAAAEAGAAATAGAAAGPGAADLDAAAWAQHFQQSQQGVADLQELLDLHRRYLRQASEDCLTFGGSRGVQDSVAGALQCLITFAFRLQAAVRTGAGRRAEETWTQALRLDATWHPLAAALSDFEERVQQLQALLQDAGSKGALAELALQLDFNGYYQRRRQRQEQQEQRRRLAVAAQQQQQQRQLAG